MVWLRDLGAISVAYLLGSIPFAYLVTRWRTGLDIRQVGVGNPGARNVWHVVGPFWGVVVALLDGAKGLAAVLLAYLLDVHTVALLLVGPAAIVGHSFPLFLRFQGGKGLSTTMGLLLGLFPWSTLISLALLIALQPVVRNLDRTVYAVAATAIFMPLAFGHPWYVPLYVLGLFGLLWLRKLQDRAHQRQVWARSGWEGMGQSDWYGRSGSDG